MFAKDNQNSTFHDLLGLISSIFYIQNATGKLRKMAFKCRFLEPLDFSTRISNKHCRANVCESIAGLCMNYLQALGRSQVSSELSTCREFNFLGKRRAAGKSLF